MSFFVLVSARPAPQPVPPRTPDVLMWLESFDGAQRVDLSSGPVRWRAGATGLGVPPASVYLSSSPGAAGAVVTGVTATPRPVLLPLTFGADGWTPLWDAIERVREITDPANAIAADGTVAPDGTFRLVAASPRGVRQLGLIYQAGLEDDGQTSTVRQNRVLDLVAPQPFAEDREEQTRRFRLVADVAPFLGGVWGQVYLTSSRIASGQTPVEMASAVPVYPTIEVEGPADSVLITADSGLRIDVPGGVAAGSTLRIVTDPRRKSIRLDGAAAAGTLALGSRLVPFGLGTTQVNVTAPGATADSELRLTWRGLHRGLW